MNNVISNQPPALSPFRFDTSPNGEADVDAHQIAVRDGGSEETGGWGADGFGFKDVLDIINPLQHIPIVSTFYRAVTGDEIAAAPRTIGGALFGGPIGLVAAIGNQIMEAETGSDIGDTAIAMFSETKEAPDVENTGAPRESSAPQLAVATPERAIAMPTPVVQTLANTPTPRVPDSLTPSDKAARAGLFSGRGRPIPASAITAQARPAATAESGTRIQSAPANALDRLIAQSQATANTAANANPSASPGLRIPTDSENVHQWMLRALGKYETMPKG